MKLTDAALRFRTTVLLFAGLLVGLGVWSYVTVPKEASPSIEIPLVTVTTAHPGASPREVEALVTFPLEREIQGVAGIDRIHSTSSEGFSFILVQFLTDVSLTEANRRVREQVDLARPGLPDDALDPVVREIDIEDLPLLTINLLAPYSLARLTDVADRLADELGTVPGVLEAEVTGGVEREVQVEVDLAALQGYGLTIDDLARAIEREHVSIPGGSIDVDRLSHQVRVDGRLEHGERIADLVVTAPGESPVYVRDVARVVPEGFRDRTSLSRLKEVRREDFAGRLTRVDDPRYLETVSVSVRARSGENVLEVAEAVEETLVTFPFPSGTETVITGDRSEVIELFIEELENHIVFGILLVSISLLFFLGLRTALLAAASIPLTFLLTFTVFRAAGMTLNFIILFSLIVVLGILVDFTIIVVENIQRHRERGRSPWDGVRASTAEVAWPVTAGLATSVAVFVPLLFWTGITGDFLMYIPLTLIVTLFSALFVALVLIPVIAGYVLETERPGEDGAREGGSPTPGRGESPARWRWGRIGGGGALAGAALVLLLANPVTLLVLTGAALLAVVLYRYLLAPGTAWFQERALPAGERWYRSLLRLALQRDYDVPRAYLRNTGALGSFTAGLALLLVGGALHLTVGPVPALVPYVPGAVLAGVGAVAILLHFLETVFLGGRVTVNVGLALAGVLLPVALFQLLQRGIGSADLAALLVLPALLVALGALGARSSRERWILTDNRARVLCLGIGGFFAILLSFAAAPTGTAFFPATDPNLIRITLEAPVGTRLAVSERTTQRAVDRIEALMESDPRVEANIKNIRVSAGVAAAAAFLRVAPEPRRSRITLTLVDYADRAESSEETLRKLRGVMERFPGATVEMEQDSPGPPVDPAVQIEVSGPEFDRLAELAFQVEDRLRQAAATGAVPGLVDVTSTLERGRPETRVRIDRERASLFGVPTAVVATTVRDAIEGRIVGTIRQEDDEWDIRVRLREEDRATLESLEALLIGGPEAGVPLLAVADVEAGTGPGSITRLDLRPVVTLQADAASGFTSRRVLGDVQTLLADFRAGLPAGYELEYTGEVREQEEEFEFLAISLVMGLGLTMLVLVAKFGSLGVASIILVAIALTMGGVILGLSATGTAFGLFTFLGVISLAGIVADDDIVLAEFIVNERNRGSPKTDAIVEGAASRFRQVTLTAVTTILGLIPLTFGVYVDFSGLLTELRPAFQLGGQNTQFWGPLGGAIIAGLPAATAVTLLVVPVAYSVLDSLTTRARAALGRPDASTSPI